MMVVRQFSKHSAALAPPYLTFAQEEPGLYAAMFENVQMLAAAGPGAAADAALDSLRRASAAILRSYCAPESAARDLAFQIWAYSHGVAMLGVSGIETGRGRRLGVAMLFALTVAAAWYVYKLQVPG
jgi:Tetracyclin repressor-like, C-terminal domain